ncbi:hypothetical protein GHK79_04670 [Enterococcus faecium]|uniref:hypothetical protein n=1 Tax=Enterococcus faecium TaxID=1352 RepID=UPI0019210F21|nr:hypothetical protein [Enterococcus faecium]EHK9937315.1 hypothetical protein [Enterococcus faecium]EMF0115923.1 hypothetical protein [Enterococcus hirae]MBL3707120.1 hypothetical protein [Enterococcus faecium]
MKKTVLTRSQRKEICKKFKCKKREFAVRKFEDGFLVSVRNKEYRVKFSAGLCPKIVLAKEVQRVVKKKGGV